MRTDAIFPALALLVVLGCESATDPKKELSLQVTLNGASFEADTSNIALHQGTIWQLTAHRFPGGIVREGFLVSVQYAGEGDYPLAGDPGMQAVFEYDPDTLVSGSFDKFRTEDASPGLLSISEVDTEAKTVSGTFSFQGRMVLPTPSDSFMTLQGSFHLRYMEVPPLP